MAGHKMGEKKEKKVMKKPMKKKVVKKKPEMSQVEIDNKTIDIKKGALSRQLGIPEEDNIPMSLLNKLKKIEVGEEFEHKGKKMKMTAPLKKRITLAITLKKMKK
jgi:uncharacterized protein with WD repeat